MGGGGSLAEVTSHPVPLRFQEAGPLPRFTERLRQRAVGGFKRSWSCLGNTAEKRESCQNGVNQERSVRNLTVRLTLSLWKGFRKFPPISPSSLGVPGWLFILRLPGEFWGEKGAKVTSQNRSTNSNPADFPDLGEAVHIA